VPSEHWHTPLFLSVNKVITAVWAAAFTVTGAGSALLHHYQPDSSGARTALTIVGIALPILFTIRYPDIARSRFVAARRTAATPQDQAQ
jgi:predicted membrane chloride channel (bestrophin family)